MFKSIMSNILSDFNKWKTVILWFNLLKRLNLKLKLLIKKTKETSDSNKRQLLN